MFPYNNSSDNISRRNSESLINEIIEESRNEMDIDKMVKNDWYLNLLNFIRNNLMTANGRVYYVNKYKNGMGEWAGFIHNTLEKDIVYKLLKRRYINDFAELSSDDINEVVNYICGKSYID